MAYYDALTGIPNRTLFYDRLQQALAYAAQNNQQVGVLYMDLDRFKQINDTLGHEGGDAVLKIVAERLVSCMRGHDTAARIAGDEFTGLICNVEADGDLAALAERILAALAEPFEFKGVPLAMSGSLGFSVFPRDGDSIELLLHRADAAMYEAKQERGRFRLYQG
jgi:diguanylate cyclase (GGDEF)-like protein